MADGKTLPLYRDDCESVKQRTEGLSCVFAKVISLDPFEIADAKACIKFDETPQGMLEIMDYAYFLIDTSCRPLRCLRTTVVPQELQCVAAYQLEMSRNKNPSL